MRIKLLGTEVSMVLTLKFLETCENSLIASFAKKIITKL